MGASCVSALCGGLRIPRGLALCGRNMVLYSVAPMFEVNSVLVMISVLGFVG